MRRVPQLASRARAARTRAAESRPTWHAGDLVRMPDAETGASTPRPSLVHNPAVDLPSLDTLRCFVEAARLKNFRAAARVVCLTPAALGVRIKQLEGQVGEPLFHRTTRKVVLTQAGLALLPQARRALEEAARCVPAARGELGPVPVELTVGTRHELGMSWVLPALPALEAEHPGLSVHLYFGSGLDLLIRVRTLEIDCAVGSMVSTDPTITSVRLHREEYVLVGAPKLLSRRPLRRAEDAANHTLIDTQAELPLFAYFRDAPGGGDRLRFSRVLRMGTIEAIRARVLAGEGVAVLPRYLVATDLATRRLSRLFPRIPLQVDHFRLFHRADDPRAAIFAGIAATSSAAP